MNTANTSDLPRDADVSQLTWRVLASSPQVTNDLHLVQMSNDFSWIWQPSFILARTLAYVMPTVT